MNKMNKMNKMNMNTDNILLKVHHYYPSNINGMRIQNAITGVLYNDVVGSHAEINYFRVIDSSCKFDDKGYKLEPNCYNYTSNKLFYDNREEWEKHIYISN